MLFKDSECRNTFKNPFSNLNKFEVYIILSLYHLKTVNEEVNIENEKKKQNTSFVLEQYYLYVFSS